MELQICKYSQISNLQRSKKKTFKMIALNGFFFPFLSISFTKEWNVST